MTVQYPPWPPPVASQTYRLASNTAYFRSPLTGSTQVSARGGGRFEFDCQAQVLDAARLANWIAFLQYVQEEGLTFYWNNYPLGRPINFPTGTDPGTPGWGTSLIDGAAQTGRTINVKALTVSAAFLPGDIISWDNGTYREMHTIKAAVTANGAGKAAITITPAIRVSPADGAPALFDGNATDPTLRAACEVMVADGRQAAWTSSGFQMNSSFKLIEVPR